MIWLWKPKSQHGQHILHNNQHCITFPILLEHSKPLPLPGAGGPAISSGGWTSSYLDGVGGVGRVYKLCRWRKTVHQHPGQPQNMLTH